MKWERAMKRKVLVLVLAVVTVFSATGCSRFVKGDYYSENIHTEPGDSESSGTEKEIRAFASLKSAVLKMVENCLEYGTVSIADDYKNGDPVADMSRACLEVTRKTAIGSFAVDYMTHAYTKTVSGYDMEIYITYKKTPEQIFAVKEFKYLSEATNAFEQLIENRDAYIAIRLDTSLMDEEYLEQRLNEIYDEQSSNLVVRPSVQAQVYPETGIQRIIEINVDYNLHASEREKMEKELSEVCNQFEIIEQQQSQMAIKLCEKLYEETKYVQTGDSLTATAYSALVCHEADSEGLALALKKLCVKYGLECKVVRGTIGSDSYCWNIITLDGENYHFDISAMYSRTTGDCLLLDDEMQAKYCSWDTENYPVCDGPLSYDDIAGTPAKTQSKEIE